MDRAHLESLHPTKTAGPERPEPRANLSAKFGCIVSPRGRGGRGFIHALDFAAGFIVWHPVHFVAGPLLPILQDETRTSVCLPRPGLAIRIRPL